MDDQFRRVDHASIRVNQAVIILLVIAGFVIGSPWLPLAVALVMAAGTAIGRPGFFFIYLGVLRPLRLVRPDVLLDNPEPHRFAQGFGAVVLLAASAALFAGAPVLGWTLAWLVAALAALNLFVGFCAGCAVYYWLNRAGVPGFAKRAPADTLPGMRPRVG